ncbi:MAG TPA: hypothetical protein VM509_16340 [Planctomycetota bacterium]|nr:hypothetical protein [Planctomycetota bacterium]
MTGLVAVLACLLIVVLRDRFTEHVWEEARLRLVTETRLLKDGLGEHLERATADELQARAVAFAQTLDLRLTLVDAEGNVLADSATNPRVMDNLATRPELVAALTEEFGICHRKSPTLGVDALFVAMAIRHDGRHVGWIRMAVPDEMVAARVRAIERYILAASAIAAFVSASLAVLWTRFRLLRRAAV